MLLFQSTADVPLCMTIFTARRNFSNKVMWVMDKIFKYTNFGWVAWMHNDFFILAVRNMDLSIIGQLESMLHYFRLTEISIFPVTKLKNYHDN